MTEALLIPEYLQNDAYIPKSIAERLTGVGERSLRGYVQDDRLQRRYYIRGNKYDLVCYNAFDILKIAHEKQLPWQMDLVEIDQLLTKDTTYPKRKKANPVIDKAAQPKPVEPIALPPEPKAQVPVLTEELMNKMATLIVDKLIDGLPKHLKEPPEKRSWKSQPYITIACIFVWACVMVYVAIKAHEIS